MDDGIGERYLRETRHSREHLAGGGMDWSRQPDWFKTYADAPRVPLPDLARDDGGLFDALARRRSTRGYAWSPLELGDLAALLWAAAGVTARQEGFVFRTAPSAGGLYPIEHYVIVNAVEGIEPGLYHYDVLGRALERLLGGDLRLQIARAALDQRFARYIFLDAGHIAENVALAATGLGLGSCQIAAFYDEEAAALLGVDPELEPVVYMTTVGRPSER